MAVAKFQLVRAKTEPEMSQRCFIKESWMGQSWVLQWPWYSPMQRKIKGELSNEHLNGLNEVNIVLNSTCKNTTLHRLRQNCAHLGEKESAISYIVN